MKKLMAAVLAAATFVTTFSTGVFAIDLSNDTDADNFFASTGAFPLTVYTDEVVHHTDVVIPDSKLYIKIPTAYSDEDYFKISGKAEEGAKYVSGIKRVTKSDTDTRKMILANGGTSANLSSRTDFLQITLKPDYTDAERKVQIKVTVKATNKDNRHSGSITGYSPIVYVGNNTDPADAWYYAGKKGVVVSPTKNDDNEIVWEDVNRMLARLTFIGDSSTNKFFPKLSTVWDNQAYADYFQDQDAFLFEFISNPFISSTSRAVLEIYNPYIDDNDEMTVAPEDVIIYAVTAEGDLYDVTDEFVYAENDEGDYVFTTKTRQLGTYIFAEMPISETIDDVIDNVPTTPEVKVPANTGRYL